MKAVQWAASWAEWMAEKMEHYLAGESGYDLADHWDDLTVV